MAKSLNGWPVLVPGSKLLRTATVPGTTRRITMRSDVLPLFLALAHDYDEWLRSIDTGKVDDGGYSYRAARAANDFSNHASGTALDINWSKEGAQGSNAGKKFFGTAEGQKDIEQIKKVYGEDIVDWGGDWRAKDYMHWELQPGVKLQKVLDRIKFLGIDKNGVRHNDLHGKPLAKPRG